MVGRCAVSERWVRDDPVCTRSPVVAVPGHAPAGSPLLALDGRSSKCVQGTARHSSGIRSRKISREWRTGRPIRRCGGQSTCKQVHTPAIKACPLANRSVAPYDGESPFEVVDYRVISRPSIAAFRRSYTVYAFAG